MGRGRRKLLPRVDQDRLLHQLERVADELADIGDVIGSVYGAAWCNKALKLHRNVHRLRQEVIDHYDDLVVEITSEDVTDLVPAAEPRTLRKELA
jgi:hypothetical protein